MIDSIGGICSSKGLPGSGKETSLAVIRRAALPVQRGLPSNPHLSVPAGDSYPVFSISTSAFAGGSCGTTIIVPPGAERAGPGEFIHDLLRVSACASEPERILCRRDDRLRTVFASRLYALGWDYLLMKELCQIFPDPAHAAAEKIPRRKFPGPCHDGDRLRASFRQVHRGRRRRLPGLRDRRGKGGRVKKGFHRGLLAFGRVCRESPRS